LDQDALSASVALIDVFPSFLDVMFRATHTERVRELVRAAVYSAGVEVEWRLN